MNIKVTMSLTILTVLHPTSSVRHIIKSEQWFVLKQELSFYYFNVSFIYEPILLKRSFVVQLTIKSSH